MGVSTPNWENFRSALFGTLAGLLVGVMLMTAVPAFASVVGDPFRLGRNNAVDARSVLRGSTDTNLKVVNLAPSGVALDLRVRPGNPPMTVNSATKVARLNADRLDGFHANALVRVAYNAIGNVNETSVFGSNTFGDIVSTQITVPTSGFLFIVGGAQSYLDGSGASGDLFGCKLIAWDNEVAGSFRNVRVSAAGGDHTSNSEEDCATSGVIPVAAGSHTVSLRITDREKTPPQADFGRASLQVLFVPFGADGARP